MEHTLSVIAKRLNAEFLGNNSKICHLGLCNRLSLYPDTLSYITSVNYWKYVIDNSNIVGLLLSKDVLDQIGRDNVFQNLQLGVIVCDYPEDVFYSLLPCFAKQTEQLYPIVGTGCNIHPTAVIENGVSIGNNVTIGPFSIIYPNTVIGDNTKIGSHCTIGSNGFQVLKDKHGHCYNVDHIGGVKIGENVYIADHVNICRALFDNVVEIGDNVLLDSYCHIAHDCSVGADSALAAGCILFGSSHVENNVWMSPGSMLMNHAIVKQGAYICPNSFVLDSTEPMKKYFGNPAILFEEFAKMQFKLTRLLKSPKKK